MLFKNQYFKFKIKHNMKKIQLITAFLSLQVLGFAQTASNTPKGIKEGAISFEEKVNMHKMIKDDAMKAYVPEFRTNKMELFLKGMNAFINLLKTMTTLSKVVVAVVRA